MNAQDIFTRVGDEPMRLAIVGSTAFEHDPVALAQASALIEQVLLHYQPELVVSGGAPGIDRLAEGLANAHALPTLVRKPRNPRWEPHGYKERNIQIAETCTHLLAIRHTSSTTYGSGWTADYAERLGRQVRRASLPSGPPTNASKGPHTQLSLL